ncbi:hypothetical protein CYMTET_28661 [Cymbomonas tetramitiformis]|uniref:Uncharacterized protein n=1 Tax=Cymbomonas tetramitiformis TaxID=36881 RepID=A0AAE0KVP2_9CHLO|nr:hypothetical protein CYMTET_28661 [Cymbomonas tetramitiformis]
MHEQARTDCSLLEKSRGEEHPFPEEELKKWQSPPRPSDVAKKQRANLVLPEGSVPLNPSAYPTFKMPENFTIGGFDQ